MSMAVENGRDFLQDSGYIQFGCGRHSIAIPKLVVVSVVSTVLICGLVVAVVILAVRDTSCDQNSSSHKNLPCDHPECNFYASKLFNGIDHNKNPCENFYEYACGRRIQQYDNSLLTYNDEMKTLAERNILRIKRILEDHSDTSELPLEKARTMYRACSNLVIPQYLREIGSTDTKFRGCTNPSYKMAYNLRISSRILIINHDRMVPLLRKIPTFMDDEASLEYIKEILNTLGGVPFIEGESWEKNTNIKNLSDLPQFYKKFKSFGYNSMLFHVSVMNDYRVIGSKLNVLISPLSEAQLNSTLALLSVNVALLKNISGASDSINMQEELNKTIDLIQLIKSFPSNNSQITNHTIKDLISATNNTIDWLIYLNDMYDGIKNFTEDDEIIVNNINIYTQLLSNLEARTIVNLEFIHFASITTTMLLRQFSFAAASFYVPPYSSIVADTTLQDNGNIDRWRKCVSMVSNAFKHVLAKKYGEIHVNVQERRLELTTMSNNIFKTFEGRIENSAWLSLSTKMGAKEKLKRMKKVLLYPKWVDDNATLNAYYQNIVMSETNHLKNVISVLADVMQKTFSLIGTPPKENYDIMDYDYLTVNAYYKPTDNSITILEGISQPSFYSPHNLKVMNYASLGMIFGHELAHGFDTTGSQFDSYGTYNDWMSPEDRQKFTEKVRCFQNQYSNFTMLPEDLPGASSFQVNGKKTVDENIADNGGLISAYGAYKSWTKENGPETLPDVLRNFTTDQVFFISFAQAWCMKVWNGKEVRNSIEKDTHAPNKFRVIGTVSNLKEFSEAFNCKATDEEQNTCSLW